MRAPDPYFTCSAPILGWQDLGHIIAGGNLRIGDIKGKSEIDQARTLGASIL